MTDEIDLENEMADQKRVAQIIEDMASLTLAPAATSQYREHDWRVRLDLLENYWLDFKRTDIVLQRYSEEFKDRSYFKGKMFNNALFKYLDLKAHISLKLQELSRLSGSFSVSSNAQRSSTQTSLEAIKLPKFKGLQRDWETFKEQFTALVMEDGSMPLIIKFQRLLNCLEDDALRAVQGIKVVADNFQAAWNTLCSKYDNKPLRFLLEMQALQNMPSSNKETATHLNSLLSTVAESINNFMALGQPVENWDDIVNFFVASKLSERTRLDWIKYVATEKLGDFPTYAQFKTFLEQRIRSLELAQPSNESSQSKSQPNNGKDGSKQKQQNLNGKSSTVNYHSSSKKGKTKKPIKCSFCQSNHFVAFCSKFLELPVHERKNFIDSHNLCLNCLNSHSLDQCYSGGSCKKCGLKHHTQIHDLYSNLQPVSIGSTSNYGASTSKNLQTSAVHVSAGQITETNSSFSAYNFVRRKGFLATAVLTFQSSHGPRMKVRALLDTGSEDSFFSEHMVQTLSLVKQRTSVVCCGIGGKMTSVAHAFSTAYLYSSSFPDFSLEVSALILKSVAANTPSMLISTASWNHLKGLKLADPGFHIPGRIDCILGTEVFAAILRNRIIRGLSDQPAALETIFGWVIFGAEQSSSKPCSRTLVHDTVTAAADASGLSKALTNFWELEEVPSTNQMTPDEQACYKHFHETHSRDAEGRFILRLPFKETPTLPDSKSLAEVCLNRQLRRFNKNTSTAIAYIAFMQEYADLRHMEVDLPREVNNSRSCYIPHHCVFKRDSDKIRVVFNASQRHSNGQSLNSFLHVGPKLQEDVLVIILRWSFFPIVFTCDVVKMFRQFLIHPEDRDWQRIVWRSSFNEDLQVYRLNTVTYGEGCAPFQSNACMLQLADDGEANFPKAAAALRQSRYADNFWKMGFK